MKKLFAFLLASAFVLGLGISCTREETQPDPDEVVEPVTENDEAPEENGDEEPE